MNKLITTTLALGLSVSAFAANDPLQNEPGFHPEYLTQNDSSASSTNVQPGVGTISKSNELFDGKHLSYATSESKNR